MEAVTITMYTTQLALNFAADQAEQIGQSAENALNVAKAASDHIVETLEKATDHHLDTYNATPFSGGRRFIATQLAHVINSKAHLETGLIKTTESVITAENHLTLCKSAAEQARAVSDDYSRF